MKKHTISSVTMGLSLLILPAALHAQSPVASIAGNIKERIQQGSNYGKVPPSQKLPSAVDMQRSAQEQKDKDSGNQKAALIDACSRLDGQKLQTLCIQKVFSH